MTGKALDGAKGTPLLQRMIEQMRIANLTESTQIAYLFEIERLAKHYGTSPVDLDAEQLRDWVLRLIDRGLSPSLTNSTLSAFRFFYIETLGCPERVAGLRNRKKPLALPRHMTVMEVERLILATPDLQHRAAFIAGLRVSETVSVKFGDIKPDRKCPAHPLRQGRRRENGPVAGRGHPLPELIAWEEEERRSRSRSRSLKRRLGAARIGRFKPLADFDWDWPRRCDRMAVEDLMTLDFLNEAANVVLVGLNGVGKSTIAANISHRAVLAGHTVRFATAASLLGALATIDSDSLLQRKLRFYARQQLLVIDEVGYLSYSNRHADLLFNIVSSRSRSHSTIITTNRPFAEWGEAFPNAACLVALVDRLVHNAEIVAIDGDSYRRKEAEQRQKERSAERRRRRSRARPSSRETAAEPPTG